MHLIRLRGPWQLEPLAKVVREVDGAYRDDSENLPPGGRTTVPSDWGELLGADFRGLVRYTRNFNRPTGLEGGERVWLVFDAVDYEATVVLNDNVLGMARGYEAAGRFDITPHLALNNRLTVDVRMPQPVFIDPTARPGRAGAAGGLIGEVRLEIA